MCISSCFKGSSEPFFGVSYVIITKKNEPEDIEFMHKYHKVDEHKLSTWNKYPNNIVSSLSTCMEIV